MSVTGTLTTRRWCYYIEGGYIYLFEIDDSNDIVPATDGIDNGLLIEYESDSNCFITATGLDDDIAPDEDSILNFSAGYLDALEAYLKSRQMERDGKFRERDYWLREFNRLLAEAADALRPGPRASIPPGPYAIR